MVCIQCGLETRVTNSRVQKRRNQVWRRRQCVSCHSIFTTQESADYAVSWVVVGSNSAIEPFLRDKLFMSLYASLQHRPTALVDAGDLCDTIIIKLSKTIVGSSLQRHGIAQTAQVALNRFDKAASIHYAAFHKY